ncbi:hypothetical protein RVIR1_06550 [Candidatus Rickettsiella viridis]|uniref:Uncharacterized protein n=1 Tax=Candidatus Rickettsiella viridis TaxID=676208 RepID=A0A2Z5UVZ0_9COXI|nr:hypothetical protein [Candidatus Rickettsiella viridis]BBB15153.1 hypothetical protein RVIR1_06550 [Candidatus Rickettsiella viridis]
MTTSILAENTVTKKMESNVVNHFSENTTNLFTGLDELLKQLSDEIAKHEPIYDVSRDLKSPEPIYDVPKATNSYYPMATLSTYDYPQSTESHADVSNSLANRPLPPLPVEPSGVSESIYEDLSSFKPAKDAVKSKTSLHQAKIYLLKSLRRCLHALNKIFSTIQSNQSNDYMQTLQDAINTDPVLDQKIRLDLAEFKYATLGSPESLEDLIRHLENIIFVLEGKIRASIRVSQSYQYGDTLSDKLKQPIEMAKLDLDQAKARLAEVKGLEAELALTNTASTQAPVSFAAIRSHQSNDYMQTLQDAINTDPVLDQKIRLNLAEFKYATLGSPESLEDLIRHLENVIFVLEGKIRASIRVSQSYQYGDMLSDKLKQPIEMAKLDLDQTKARLAEVKGLEAELALTNTASTQAPVSTVNNRFTLFGKTTPTTNTMVENALYDSMDTIKGMTRSAG